MPQTSPPCHSPSRPAAPDPSLLPSSSPPFHDRRRRDRTPPLPPALMPPKKRRMWNTTPVTSPPPAPTAAVPAADTVAVSTSGLLPLVALANPRPSMPPPTVGAEHSARPPRPKPSQKVQKVIKKVIVKKAVPKCTFPARKANATALTAAGASESGGETRTGKPTIHHVVAADKAAGKELQGMIETIAGKQCTCCNFAAAPAAKSGGETPTVKPTDDRGAATGGRRGKKQDMDVTVVHKPYACIAADAKEGLDEETESGEIVAEKPSTACNFAAVPPAGASNKSGGETPTEKPAACIAADAKEGLDEETESGEIVAEKPSTDCNFAAVPPAGASKSGGETPTYKPADDHDAATGDAAGKEHGMDEILKASTGCSGTAVKEELGEGKVSEETLAGKLATDFDAQMWEAIGMSERHRRRMKEVFVGGLDRDAMEEDVRAVFEKAGEITEVRLIMDPYIRKNKGYCFVRFREAAQAKKAIADFGTVEICGKLCETAAPDGNDVIYLGNIDKKWTKEDIIELLQKIGVRNVEIMADSNNPNCNRGFALLELRSSKHARTAYEKLSKKDVFGRGLTIRVALPESLNSPDEENTHKVKHFKTGRDKKSPKNHDLHHVLREQDTWSHPHIGFESDHIQEDSHIYCGEKQLFSTLGNGSTDRMREHYLPRHGSSTCTTTTLSGSVLPSASTISSPPYFHDRSRRAEGLASYCGVTGSSANSQMRQSGSHKQDQPYGSRHYQKSD